MLYFTVCTGSSSRTYDFELASMSRTPKVGYEDVYIEKTMLDRSVKRRYWGKRFVMTTSYAFLTAGELSDLNEILAAQRNGTPVSAQITAPGGSFSGNVLIDLDKSQTRFSFVNPTAQWIDFKLTIKGVSVIG